MQMKINLDKIFGTSKTQESIIDFKTEDFHHSQIQSSQNYDIQYHLNMPLFDDTIKTQDNKSHQSHNFKTGSIRIQENNNFQDSRPGQRLYYQSQNNFMRKKQQIQKLKQQQQIQQRKNITFKPQINKKSQKILQKKAVKSGYLEKKKTQKQVQFSTVDRKMNQQEKQCTFKPQLISKKSKNVKNRQKDKVFQGLFNHQKLKQAKAKLLYQEQEIKKRENIKQKKVNFQQFLIRNNQYRQKVHKKQQLIVKTSQKYDLNSGKKMFTPETCSYTPKVSRHQKYFQNQQQIQNFKPKSIFQKNVQAERQQLFHSQQKQKQKISFQQNFPIHEQQEQQQILQEITLKHVHGQTTNFDGNLPKQSQQQISQNTYVYEQTTKLDDIIPKQSQQISQETTLTQVHQQIIKIDGNLSKQSQFSQIIQQNKSKEIQLIEHQTQKSSQNIQSNQ